MKLSVAIPVYNERDTVGFVLKRVGAAPHEKEIILIDGASTDRTREIPLPSVSTWVRHSPPHSV